MAMLRDLFSLLPLHILKFVLHILLVEIETHRTYFVSLVLKTRLILKGTSTDKIEY